MPFSLVNKKAVHRASAVVQLWQPYILPHCDNWSMGLCAVFGVPGRIFFFGTSMDPGLVTHWPIIHLSKASKNGDMISTWGIFMGHSERCHLGVIFFSVIYTGNSELQYSSETLFVAPTGAAWKLGNMDTTIAPKGSLLVTGYFHPSVLLLKDQKLALLHNNDSKCNLIHWNLSDMSQGKLAKDGKNER